MKAQLRQVFFLALFATLCTAFIFFVPWGKQDASQEEIPLVEKEESSVKTGVSLLEWSLDILVSPQVLTQEFKDFSASFAEERGGKVVFHDLHSVDELSSFSGIDLVLLPFDMINSGQLLSPIRFQEDIAPLFIFQLHQFIGQHPNFLPVAIDPAVIIASMTLWDGLDGLQLAFQERSPKTLLSAFSFWLFDASVLRDQNLIFSQQLKDFIQFNDIGAFKMWLKMNPLNRDQQQKLFQVSNAFQLWDLLLKRDLLGSVSAFYSTLHWSGFGSFARNWYPYQYEGIPVRLYGFFIPEGWQDRALVEQFLLDYMDWAFEEWDSFLFPWMIPVFKNQFSKGCWETACNLPLPFSPIILKNWDEQIDFFLKDPFFQKLLEEKIQLDLYLQRVSL